MVRVGIVGLGYWGPNLVRNFQHHPNANVTALHDLNEAVMKKASLIAPAATPCKTFEELLELVDAVAIATPLRTHFALAKQALEAGKHVVIEKPMAASMAEAIELTRLAEKSKLMLAVDHTFLFTGAVMKVEDVVNKGDIGNLWYYDSQRVNLGLFQHDTNVIWDLAPHDLSIMMAVVKEAPCRVHAHGAVHTDVGHCDMAWLHFLFPSGLVANCHVSWLSPVKVRRIVIAGSSKMVVYDEMDVVEKVRIFDKGIDQYYEPDNVDKAKIQYRIGDVYAPHIDNTEALQLLVDNFLKSIEEGHKVAVDGYDGARVVRVLEACDESLAKGGAPVDIEWPEELKGTPK